MLHKLHMNIILLLHVDIVYFASKRQKCTTVITLPKKIINSFYCSFYQYLVRVCAEFQQNCSECGKCMFGNKVVQAIYKIFSLRPKSKINICRNGGHFESSFLNFLNFENFFFFYKISFLSYCHDTLQILEYNYKNKLLIIFFKSNYQYCMAAILNKIVHKF